jgi:hypothetical protein
MDMGGGGGGCGRAVSLSPASGRRFSRSAHHRGYFLEENSSSSSSLPLSLSSSTSAQESEWDGTGGVLYVPKCMCILSHWPQLRAFRRALTHLYTLSLSSSTFPVPQVCI